MCWLRGSPRRISGAYSGIMLHASIVGLICSCCVSCTMFMLVMPCYSDDLMIIPVNPVISMLLSVLNASGYCELASTFNVLT
mgnify:CR=1 FL=1